MRLIKKLNEIVGIDNSRKSFRLSNEDVINK